MAISCVCGAFGGNLAVIWGAARKVDFTLKDEVKAGDFQSTGSDSSDHNFKIARNFSNLDCSSRSHFSDKLPTFKKLTCHFPLILVAIKSQIWGHHFRKRLQVVKARDIWSTIVIFSWNRLGNFSLFGITGAVFPNNKFTFGAFRLTWWYFW